MNRRNFIGRMLAVGARFFVLPSAGRIWVPSREIVKEEVQSIWQTHRITYDFRFAHILAPRQPAKLGDIVKLDQQLWYGTSQGWLPLVRMSRPLKWKAWEHKNWDPWTCI